MLPSLSEDHVVPTSTLALVYSSIHGRGQLHIGTASATPWRHRQSYTRGQSQLVGMDICTGTIDVVDREA